MTEQTRRLRAHILRELNTLEQEKGAGNVVVVHPELDDLPQEAFVISFDGSSWEEVERELRWLRTQGLIDSGGVSDPAIGIHFSHLTPAGKSLLWS